MAFPVTITDNKFPVEITNLFEAIGKSPTLSNMSSSDVWEELTIKPTISIGNAGGSAPYGTSIDFTTNLTTKTGKWDLWTGSSATNMYIPERYGNKITFNFTGPRFAIRVGRVNGSIATGISILVDGKILTKLPFDVAYQGLNNITSSPQYITVDFGTNTTTFKASSASIVSGGTGYVLGDLITLSGGTNTTPAILRVTSVNASNVVQSVQVINQGSYSLQAANVVSQGSTTGTGTGATFNLFWEKVQTTYQSRRIDIIVDNGVVLGNISYDANSIINRVPFIGPKLLIAGDSITAYSRSNYALGNWAQQTAKRLGFWDKYVHYGTSGRGYIQSTPFSLDIPGIILENPNLIVIALGTNDSQNTVDPVLFNTTVKANLNTLLDSLPNVLIVVVGGFVDKVTGDYNTLLNTAITEIGSNRISFINFFNFNLYKVASNSIFNSSYGLTSDIHPSQLGHDVISKTLAPFIAESFYQMMIN